MRKADVSDGSVTSPADRGEPVHDALYVLMIHADDSSPAFCGPLIAEWLPKRDLQNSLDNVGSIRLIADEHGKLHL